MHIHNPLGMEQNEVIWNEISLFGFLKFEWNWEMKFHYLYFLKFEWNSMKHNEILSISFHHSLLFFFTSILECMR
jgi:hypothetical protein